MSSLNLTTNYENFADFHCCRYNKLPVTKNPCKKLIDACTIAARSIAARLGDLFYFQLQNSTFVMVVLAFLFSFHVGAEEFTGQITIEKTSFHVNEEFKFTIFIPTISPSGLRIEEPEFSDGIEIISGPSIRPGRDGSIVDYTFKLNKTGRYIIESFTIKSSGKVMHTTPVLVIATFQGHSFDRLFNNFEKIPPSVRWDIPKDNYYPGEIIPLRFAVENIENPDLLIESEVSQKTDGYVKKISRLSEESERTIIPKKFMTEGIYDVLFHDHIFVPFRAGNITLPNVEIYLSEGDSSYRTTLKGVSVLISALPESEENTGALGNYSYEYEISDNKLSDSQAVILKQKITGIGNFYGITMPAPYISKAEIADIFLIKDTYDVVPAGNLTNAPDQKFFKGSRELIYSIRKKPNEMLFSESAYPKTISIIIPDFSWFSKKSFGSLYPSTGAALELKPEKSPGAVLDLTLEENTIAQPISRITRTDKEAKVKKNLLGIFRIILIISVIPSLFFVLKKKMKKSIVVFSIIVLAAIIGFLIITKVLIKQPVYGIVNDDPCPVNVYVIPEESATIKFSVENGEKIKIIGEKDLFYLIEADNKGSRGWAKKENIIVE